MCALSVSLVSSMHCTLYAQLTTVHVCVLIVHQLCSCILYIYVRIYILVALECVRVLCPSLVYNRCLYCTLTISCVGSHMIDAGISLNVADSRIQGEW